MAFSTLTSSFSSTLSSSALLPSATSFVSSSSATAAVSSATSSSSSSSLPEASPYSVIPHAPRPGVPVLQSQRLNLYEHSTPFSKSFTSKMQRYLKVLDMPERPLPTRKVCDLVDDVRRNTSILLSLHNILRKKEKELASLISSSHSTVSLTATTKATKGKSKFFFYFFLFLSSCPHILFF